VRRDLFVLLAEFVSFRRRVLVRDALTVGQAFFCALLVRQPPNFRVGALAAARCGAGAAAEDESALERGTHMLPTGRLSCES